MKNKQEFWILLFFALFVVGCIALSAWIIYAIVNSDLPLWLKFLLLR